MRFFYHSEKMGGPSIPQSVIDNFWDSFINAGLYDLGYSGYDFTWCNYQQNGVVVEERLDWFCADTKWSLLFPKASASHIDFELSDHFPFLLKCRPNVNKNGDRQKLFLFDNMWITDPSCTGVISSSWVKMSDPDAVHNLLLKLDECAGSLADSNKHTFGYAGAEIRKLEVQLHGQHDAISRR